MRMADDTRENTASFEYHTDQSNPQAGTPPMFARRNLVIGCMIALVAACAATHPRNP